MTTYEPDHGFRVALTRIDLGEADLIVTMAVEAAHWAEQNGYRVTRELHRDNVIYEIRSGEPA